MSKHRNHVWLLLVAALAHGAAALSLQVPVQPRGCAQIAISMVSGAPLLVHLAGTSSGGAGDGAGGTSAPCGCAASQFTLRGVDSGGLLRGGSCAHTSAMKLPSLAGYDGGHAALSSFGPVLAIESSCTSACVLTLEVSVGAGRSQGWGPGGIPAGSSAGSAAGGSSWASLGSRAPRKLLQPPGVIGRSLQGRALQQQERASSPPTLPQPDSTARDPGSPQRNDGTGSSGVAGGRAEGGGRDKDPTLPVAPARGSGGAPPSSQPLPAPYPPPMPLNDSYAEEMVCCCGRDSPLPYLPDQYTQRSCCCGRRKVCCVSSALLSRMCGDGAKCGVLLVVVGVVSLFVFFLCFVGWMAFKRRMVRAEVARAAEDLRSRRQPRTPEEFECAAMLDLSPDKQAEVSVRPAAEGDAGFGACQECPICLERVEMGPGSWSVFPCHHGVCSPCLVDCVRHTKRRIPAHQRVLHCPLCRKFALVPASLLPEGVLEIPGSGLGGNDASDGDIEAATAGAEASPAGRSQLPVV